MFDVMVGVERRVRLTLKILRNASPSVSQLGSQPQSRSKQTVVSVITAAPTTHILATAAMASSKTAEAAAIEKDSGKPQSDYKTAASWLNLNVCPHQKAKRAIVILAQVLLITNAEEKEADVHVKTLSNACRP